MKGRAFHQSMLDWSSKMWILYASRGVINQSPEGYKWTRTLFYKSVEGLGGEDWLLELNGQSQSTGLKKPAGRL